MINVTPNKTQYRIGKKPPPGKLGVILLWEFMLTDKKIETAIKSFSISCMNNVKWKRVCTKIAEFMPNKNFHLLGKPVWAEGERRILYRLYQVKNNGISDPGLFGNDREEFKQIEYLKVVKHLSDPSLTDNFKSWCVSNNIEFFESDDALIIYGYKK